jgi:excisionase family DNA binding protein
MDDRDYVTIKEAQAIVKVSRRTIYNWIEHGRLTVRRTAGGNLRILRDSLWLADKTPTLTEG